MGGPKGRSFGAGYAITDNLLKTRPNSVLNKLHLSHNSVKDTKRLIFPKVTPIKPYPVGWQAHAHCSAWDQRPLTLERGGCLHCITPKKTVFTHFSVRLNPGGGGVLPYITYTCMCRPTGS